MKVYSNINDFLIDNLFLIDEASGYYFKYYTPNRRYTIPFTALAGHTVESFQKLAEKEGWIEDPHITAGIIPYDRLKESENNSLTCHAPNETPPHVQINVFENYHNAIIAMQQFGDAIKKAIDKPLQLQYMDQFEEDKSPLLTILQPKNRK